MGWIGELVKTWRREKRRAKRGKTCEGCGKRFIKPKAHVCRKDMARHLEAAGIPVRSGIAGQIEAEIEGL